MRFLVLLCLLFASSKIDARPTHDLSQDMPDFLLHTIRDAIICSRQVGPEAEELQNIKTEGILPEDNESFNEYFGCIWKRKGIVGDNNGQVNRNNLRSYLVDLFTMGEEITPMLNILVDDVLEHCENIQEGDYGLTAVKIHNCVVNRLHKLVGDKD